MVKFWKLDTGNIIRSRGNNNFSVLWAVYPSLSLYCSVEQGYIIRWYNATIFHIRFFASFPPLSPHSFDITIFNTRIFMLDTINIYHIVWKSNILIIFLIKKYPNLKNLVYAVKFPSVKFLVRISSGLLMNSSQPVCCEE